MPSAFITEIEQHPKAIRDLIAFYRGEGSRLLRDWRSRAEKAHRIIFTGMGTSEFVAESILPKLAEQGLDATSIDAGELLHYPRAISGLLVLISQSGESAETRKLAERLRNAQNWVALTNNPQSTIATLAPLNLPMLAGAESAIAAKTYANTLAVLFLMSVVGRTVPSTPGPALDRLDAVAKTMTQIAREPIKRAADLLSDAAAIHFVSRGPAMTAARQSALTFMEGTRTSATAFTGGGFRHGPYELVDASHRCVFFIPSGKTFTLLQSMAIEVASKGSRVIIITDQEFTPPSRRVCILTVPCYGEELFSLAAAPTQELLLEALAQRKKIIPGAFRNSQKITSTE